VYTNSCRIAGESCRRELKEIRWTKGRELAKLARAEGEYFDCARWVHKLALLREEFRRELEKALNGRKEESWDSSSTRAIKYGSSTGRSRPLD
jgi:hypothetical protein